MTWWRWIVSGAVIVILAQGGVADAEPSKIYVADEEAGTVSVIDARMLTRAQIIPAGRDPHNVQVSPDGKLAWVTNNGEDRREWEREHKGMPKRAHEAMQPAGEVWAIDTATDKVVAKVPVGLHPA